MKSRLTEEELAYLTANQKLPMWIDLHVQQVAKKLGSRNASWLSKEQKAVIAEECRKLDAFCETLCTSGVNHIEAEKKAFGISGGFYRECDKIKAEWRLAREKEKKRKERELAREKARLEAEYRRLQALKLKPEFSLETNLHLEQDLNAKQKEELSRSNFMRLKISPFGDSGAAYYWVRTHWNESKEHAFFCYIIEHELRKHTEEVTVNTYESPDVEFEYKNFRFGFEVETGSILKRNKHYLVRRYRELKRNFTRIYILVTSKKLKYKYSKFGEVVTRGTLKRTIAKMFRDMDWKPKQKR